MKRLQTHIALLSTLIAIDAMLIVGIVCMALGKADPRTLYAILPTSVIVLIVGLIVGRNLTGPLHALTSYVRNYRHAGQTGTPANSMNYREVNELSNELNLLVMSAEEGRKELKLMEENQSDFVSDVAHEIRTPLTAIRGTAEMLSDPDLPPELHERFCDSIVRECERLSRLTSDLINLERTRDGDPSVRWERLDLCDVARDAVDALTSTLNERGAVVEIIGEAPEVMGDRDRLIEVVTNLVDNASRFIEPGGHIWINASGGRGISVISVADDGAGFGDTDPHLLFERFFRTDFSRARNAGGSGLGLAIVKSIVEAHHGTVEALARPEGGACFMVTLPSAAKAE